MQKHGVRVAFVASAFICISACAVFDRTLPVLGTIEDGRYLHVRGAYNCPLPSASEGFAGPVDIIDAARIFQPAPNTLPPRQNEQIGRPAPGDTKIVPNNSVTFTDNADNATQLEIAVYHPNALQTPYRPYDREDNLQSGYSGGLVGVLREGRGILNEEQYGFAIIQTPYFSKNEGPGYMGVDMWRAYLRREVQPEEPGPYIKAIFNIHEGKHLYRFQLRYSSVKFLPPDINPRDTEETFLALSKNSALHETLEATLRHYVAQCRLTPER